MTDGGTVGFIWGTEQTHFLRITLSLDRKLLHMHIFSLPACLAQKTRFLFDLCCCQPQLQAGFSPGFVWRAGSITWTVCFSFRVSLFPPPQQVRKSGVDTCCKPLNQGPSPILLPRAPRGSVWMCLKGRLCALLCFLCYFYSNVNPGTSLW